MFSKVSLLFLLPALAWSFTFLTEGMKGWDRDDLRISFNPANCSIPAEEVEASIEEAARAWNRVPTAQMRVRYAGRTELTGTQENPIIECATSGLDDSIGVTRVSTMNGRIFTGYVELNAEASSDGNIINYRGDRLSLVIAHELGHVLGLGHSASQSALMHYTIGGKEQLTLAQDDIDGFSYLYPRNEPEDGALGCGSISSAGGAGGAGGGGLLAVLSVVGIFTLLVRARSTGPGLAAPAC